MAVCPKCNGNGSVLYPIDYEQGLFDETNCDLCGGSGEVEMTNEEYIRTCTTKQLAELLAFLVYEVCICKNGGRGVAEEISKLQKMQNSPCEHCGCNPKNGGSGLCNCTLACPKIT